MEPLYWNVDPEITTLFGVFPIKYYGLFFVTGLLLSYTILKKIFLSENIPLKNLDTLTNYVFIGTLVGARLGHCLFYDFAYFWQHPLEIFLPFKISSEGWDFTGFAGLASHGGAIGILIAITLFVIKTKTPFLWIMDKVSIVIPIGCAFIRFGNFMNSEIYGKPTNRNYGVVFVKDDLITRHPTQLYEAFSFLAIFVILWYLNKKKIFFHQNGVVFGIFLILMFSARFIIEFSKENQVAFEDTMTLNMGQLLSIPFIIVGIILITLRILKKEAATS
ncbi:prolipoprotein diacylglyceryl transferase [Aquimarina sp. BL5]|uniref:prolipoprotein diacylglyceryl transferase n=1 Tax=Aquimarina sp. BL5 TaxID=1714860 RepID=UPI000E4C2F71|nr:prolipoprotein diacylglyceryl transferase [Aquimarina sp. BL5]AXT52304.1 prolipoprotein diacylglyceryl transferase [Aquimarina sp. BL5]RKN09975.1 prolipoprotein diacylglyceryl transferase [Aquimarina sp. BL5]